METKAEDKLNKLQLTKSLANSSPQFAFSFDSSEDEKDDRPQIMDSFPQKNTLKKPSSDDYDFEDFESQSDHQDDQEEETYKLYLKEETKHDFEDSKTNPHLLISEHGQQVEDIKNKVINIADLEGFDPPEVREDHKKIDFERFDSTEGHHQDEEHTIPKKTNSRLGIVALTPVENLPNQENEYDRHAFESLETKPLNDQSRDQELLNIMENTLKKDDDQNSNHSFNFEPQHEEVGGAND